MLLRNALQIASPSGRRAKLSILIFHRVLDAPDPLLPDEPDVVRFDQIVSWIANWFNILPLEEAVARLKKGALPARSAAITFDDGYTDNLTNATPILNKRGVHATFFIATGFLDGGLMWNDAIIETVRRATVTKADCEFLGLGQVEIQTLAQKRLALTSLIAAVKYLPSEQRLQAVSCLMDCFQATLPQNLMLTSRQVCELRDAGMGIGAHTVNHPILARVDDALARREIAEGRDFIEGLLGERIGLFAYPNGRRGRDYTSTHVEMVKSLGFDAAVATNWGTSSLSDDIFQLARFTPWDTNRWRYGSRLLMNVLRADQGS